MSGESRHPLFSGRFRTHNRPTCLELLLAVSPPRKQVASCLLPFADGPHVGIEDQLDEFGQVSPDEFARGLDGVDTRQLVPSGVTPDAA